MMAPRVEMLSPDLDAIGDWSAPEGSEPWAKALRIGLQRCVDSVAMYPQQLRGLVEKAIRHEAWTKLRDAKGLPFPTFAAFCSTPRPHGLGRAFAEIEPYILAAAGGNRAVAAAQTTRPEAAPTLSDAGKKGGHEAGRGRPKAGDNDNGPIVARGRGTDPDYLAARIARDFPEVHERMKRGEFPSVRAAAREAGLVKPVDVVKAAARAVAKVPPSRLSELADTFAATLPDQPSGLERAIALADRLERHDLELLIDHCVRRLEGGRSQ